MIDRHKLYRSGVDQMARRARPLFPTYRSLHDAYRDGHPERFEPAKAPWVTLERPGTPLRVAVYRWRLLHGYELHAPGDAQIRPDMRALALPDAIPKPRRSRTTPPVE